MKGPKNFVAYTPVVCMFLLETGHISQVFKMWAEKSSLGQNVWGWMFVNLALILWVNYYRLMLPDQKLPLISGFIGVLVNFIIIFTILHYG